MILRYIHYFLAVAECGSFTRAAEALHVSQPALSQQIKLLEQALDVQLFDRSARTIRLTDAGRVYQRYATQAMKDLEAGKRAIHDVQDLQRGTLRLGVTPTYTPWLVGPLMAEFRARWPGIHLAINEATQDKIEQQLIADELDVGLGYAGEHSVDLQRISLMQEALSLVVNNNHPLAKRSSLILADLDALPLVLLNTGFTTRTEIDHHLHQQGVAPSIVVESNTLGVVLELIEHAPLAALLPDTLARRHATLIALKIEPAFAERSGVMLMRQGSIHAASQALKSLLTEILKDGWGDSKEKC